MKRNHVELTLLKRAHEKLNDFYLDIKHGEAKCRNCGKNIPPETVKNVGRERFMLIAYPYKRSQDMIAIYVLCLKCGGKVKDALK